jgi:hypothetical protein
MLLHFSHIDLGLAGTHDVLVGIGILLWGVNYLINRAVE